MEILVRWGWVALSLPAILLASGCATLSGPPATPQRPSYSSDTNTTAPGSVEVEAGVVVDDADGASAPVALKFGAGEASEFFLGWSPWVHLEDGTQEVDGAGDLVVGTRYRFLEARDGAPSAAFQVGAKLPTADDDEGLGSGQVDAFGSLALAGALGRAGWVAYYQLAVLGEPEGGDAQLEHGLAAAVGHPLAGDLSGFVELATILTPAQDSEQALVTLGLGYALRPWWILDAAAVLGLTEDATDAQGTVGFTWNLGRVE